MSHQCIADAFAKPEADYKSKVMEHTWGHLAPKRNKIYPCRIVFAVGIFGDDALNPTAIHCHTPGLESSPWFFDAMMDFMQDTHPTEGKVYEFIGTFKNYRFSGNIKIVFEP